MSELVVNSEVDVAPKSSNPVSHEAERDLMQSISNNEPNSLEQLVATYGKALATFIGRLMAWHDDCDDVFQDVLMIAWQRASQYQGQGPLEGWLKRIAINRCRNHFRATNVLRRKIQQLGQRLVFANRQPAATVFPRSDQKHPIQNEALDAALKALSPQDRMAIVLFYLEGYSGKEVARELKVEVDTLHVRLHRIKKRLKKTMESS